jgi:hypothetical protein
MIEMLKRPQGATVEQIAAATGWQHHTIRGAISGALSKYIRIYFVLSEPRAAYYLKARVRTSMAAAVSPALGNRRWTC